MTRVTTGHMDLIDKWFDHIRYIANVSIYTWLVLKLTSQASGNHDLERPFALLKISSFPNEFKIGLTTLRLRERGCRALKDDTLLPEERKERDEEIVSGGKEFEFK